MSRKRKNAWLVWLKKMPKRQRLSKILKLRLRIMFRPAMWKKSRLSPKRKNLKIMTMMKMLPPLKSFIKRLNRKKAVKMLLSRIVKKLQSAALNRSAEVAKSAFIILWGAMMTMMIMVSVGLAAVSKRNSLSLFSRFNRRKRLLKKLSFLRLLRFRNWLTVWPKRVPMLLKN